MYHSRKNPSTVSFQSKRLRRSVEPRRGAGRRNLGTRVRHNSLIARSSPIECEAAPYKEFAPPVQTKNFPQEHPQKAKRTKFTLCKGGCSWGKFWEGQGGLEGRKPSTKEGFLPSKVFPLRQAQDIVVGFSSVMITLFRKSTALRKPSSIVMTLSSCSIDRTRS